MGDRISARNWEAILYPENMRENWQDIIDELITYPSVYIIHDKDPHTDKITGEVKDGVHVHYILHYSNSTTQNCIISLINRTLSKRDDKGNIINNCCSTAEPVGNMQYAYDYLIHITDKAIKQGKHQYKPEERILLNHFDIHFLAEDDEYEKNLKVNVLAEDIAKFKFTNYMDFYNYVNNTYDITYVNIQKANHSYFNTLIKGNYCKFKKEKDDKELDNKEN